jgi:hypothetical protein
VALQQQLAAIGCGAEPDQSDKQKVVDKAQSAEEFRITLSDLQQQFLRWQQAALALQNYQGKQQARIQQLAGQLAITSDIALQWLAVQQADAPQEDAGKVVSHGGVTSKSRVLQQQQLQTIISDVDEEVLTLAQVVLRMLDCQQVSP